jgi:transposase
MLLSEGQMSDYKGAALMIDAFPKAKALLADRGYDANWFRHALAERGITPCIPSKTNRKVPIPHDTALYRQRHKVENMFGKLKPVLSLSKGTGAVSTPATIDAPTPSCPPYASPQPSSSGCRNES